MAAGRRWAALLSSFSLACAPAVRQAPPARFYHGRPYGTEAQFNPLTEIANEGFDIFRVYSQFRSLSAQPWRQEASDILHTLAAPGHTYKHYGGFGLALRNELLPLSTPRSGGGQWLPNYEFHLIGSGMVSVRMAEWFEAHHTPAPAVASFVTMSAAHFLNEMMENGGAQRYDEDSLTDLYVFDLGGFFLFRDTRVQRFFDRPTLTLTNWPLQPTYFPDGHTIENAGQQFVLRWRIPGRPDWRLLYDFGISNQLGVSRDVGRGYALSFALGVDAARIKTLDAGTGRRTTGLTPSAGVYVDREGSLLASLTGATATRDAVLSLNVYPGVIGRGRFSPGVWAQVLRDGSVRFGVAPLAGLGIGGGGRGDPRP